MYKRQVEDTGKVQHVEMKDEVPTGSIVINKDGQFVTDTTLMKGCLLYTSRCV